MCVLITKKHILYCAVIIFYLASVGGHIHGGLWILLLSGITNKIFYRIKCCCKSGQTQKYTPLYLLKA
jgi:hypothetical protein